MHASLLYMQTHHDEVLCGVLTDMFFCCRIDGIYRNCALLWCDGA